MKKFLFVLSLIAIIFTGCKKDDDDPTQTVGQELSGDITGEATLDASVTYSLTGTLVVKDGAVLTIPAGTTIEATKGYSSYVIVEQGGKIYANGTASNPVTFTSAEASPEAGDWGGIIINGYAPISGGGTAKCEMNDEYLYGGDDETDSSGSLTYVIIEYSGAQISEKIEHNGLTLDAVGSGTVINNLYVVDGADDAIEFFGGSVNVTNILAVNPDDDMFDVTQGWNGTLTNAYGIWESGYVSSEDDPRGIEADGNLDGLNPEYSAQSDFTMKDVTIKNASDFLMEDGIKIRRSATAKVINAVLLGGTAKDLIDLSDSKSNANTATSVSLTVDRAAHTSKEINSADTYANVEIVSGNTGADISEFAWTGYTFDDEPTADLSGDISESTRLNALYTYNLSSTLVVENGASLIIPAGTTIEATKGYSSYVIVEQGGIICANGTADAPVTFTSAESSPAAGDWGGIIINGYAPISGGGTAKCEMNDEYLYGGTNEADSSGVLTYVIIKYSGAQISEKIEHNGLTLDAVGNKTVIENIYVAEGADDAIEFFGGSVNASNILAVNPDDDMFDLTQGWSGTLSNAYGVWESGYVSSEDDPRGIEADGNLDGLNPEYSGQSDFTMENITIKNLSDFTMNAGVKIRRGATGTLTNILLTGGTTKNIIDLVDGKGFATDATTISYYAQNVTAESAVIANTKDLDGDDVAETCNATVTENSSNTGASTSQFDWTGYSF